MIDVSVLTPSYGYAHYIGDCLTSVTAQTGVSVQHVVQDGASTDGTIDVLRAHEGPGLDWASAPDSGQSDALNKALRRATGRWIGWLNADEFYLPGALERLVALGEETGAGVVYGDTAFVDAEGRFLRMMAPARFDLELLRGGRGCYISSVSVLMRRDVLGEDPWDPTARVTMDWDLYLGLARAGVEGRSTKQPVGAFREHDERVTAEPQGPAFRTEKLRISERHGGTHATGDRARLQRQVWRYRAEKLVHGGYLRERRARALAGQDLRWFADGVDRLPADRLVATGS